MDSPLFSQAYAAHRAGRLDDAERGYRTILASDPTHARALHMLGVIRHQRGEHGDAVELLARAAKLEPGDAGVQLNLANAFKALGLLDDAIVHFSNALRLQPDFGVAHFNLGNAYASSGRHEEAVASYGRAIQVQPDSAPSFNNLGTSLQALERHEQALDAFREALRLQPSYAGAYNNLGMTLNALGSAAAALDAFAAAVRLQPDFTVAHFNLGNTLDALQRPADALVPFANAARLQPRFAPARYGQGSALAALGRHREAIVQYEQAVGLDPNFHLAWMNLGASHYALGAYDAALRALNQALRLQPELAGAHYNRALILLLRGAFREGWAEYEWRLRLLANAEAWHVPRWRHGETLVGRTLLIHAEQGFGDTLQFVQFIPFVPLINRAADPTQTLGGRVLLEVQRELLPLLAPHAAQWGVELLARGTQRPPFDCHCPLLSLPQALGWSGGRAAAAMADFPAGFSPGASGGGSAPASILRGAPVASVIGAGRTTRGYLQVPEVYRRKWQKRLAGTHRRKIGIVWSGRVQPRGETRAVPVALLEPLFALPDIDWYVLQTDCSPADRAWLDEASGRVDDSARGGAGKLGTLHWPGTPSADFNGFSNFADTAACIEQLDAVVSIDTAVAHLAGALGKPVWIMLPFVSDWRWFLDTSASPWYPGARLVRQSASGDWPGVIARVRGELAV